MQWHLAISISVVLLAGQVASAGLLSHNSPLRRDALPDRILRRRAASIVNADYVEKRDAVAGSTTANESEWNRQTETACVSALSKLRPSELNECGMAVCYNIPTLDSKTGAFQVDMRLYRVGSAGGKWAGLSVEGLQVQLSYSGAMVEPVNSLQFAKRDALSMISGPATRRGNGLEIRATTPQLQQAYTFKGSINAGPSISSMSDADIKQLVVPSVMISAMSIQNIAVFNTTLNSTQAAFLVGALSGKSVNTNTAAAAQAPKASSSGGLGSSASAASLATSGTTTSDTGTTGKTSNLGSTSSAGTNGNTDTTVTADPTSNTGATGITTTTQYTPPAGAAAAAEADGATGTTTTTQYTPPAGEAAAAVSDVANSNTAESTAPMSPPIFVMPGTKIVIFPIGGIITGTWAMLFISTVVYGTMGRIQFRDQYRRQAARQIDGSG